MWTRGARWPTRSWRRTTLPCKTVRERPWSSSGSPTSSATSSRRRSTVGRTRPACCWPRSRPPRTPTVSADGTPVLPATPDQMDAALALSTLLLSGPAGDDGLPARPGGSRRPGPPAPGRRRVVGLRPGDRLALPGRPGDAHRRPQYRRRRDPVGGDGAAAGRDGRHRGGPRRRVGRGPPAGRHGAGPGVVGPAPVRGPRRAARRRRPRGRRRTPRPRGDAPRDAGGPTTARR